MTEQGKQMSKEERIGYHQGALECLIKERQELLRLVSIVEQLIQMHVNGLKEMGIDLQQMQQPAAAPQQAPGLQKKPIEDLLKRA